MDINNPPKKSFILLTRDVMKRLRKQNWYIITFFVISITLILLSNRYWDTIIWDKWYVWQRIECNYDWGDIYSSNLVSWVVLYSEWDLIVASWTCVDFEQIITEQPNWSSPWVSQVEMREIWTRQCEDTKLKINCNRIDPIWKYKDMVKNAKIWNLMNY